MRRLLLSVRSKIYFVPVLYSLTALFLSIVVVYIDHYQIDKIASFLPAQMFVQADLAVVILSSLTGALLTMIIMSFSTMMVVLTLYAGQFSPRTVKGFLERKATLRILGLFMGAFIYSLISLYFTRESTYNKLTISASVGVIVAIACLAIFAYFVHHVVKSIQINNFIEYTTDEVIELIDKKISEIDTNKNICNQPDKEVEKLRTDKKFTIKSEKHGYIQLIDEKAMMACAENKNIIVKFEAIIGDYINSKTEIMTVYYFQSDTFNNIDEITKDLLEAISIGDERNSREDLNLGISKLVEIGLRALSPGVNDPNTAIFCISKIGTLLKKISNELEKIYYYDEENNLRLIIENLYFNDLLYNTYFQLKAYCTKDVAVIGAMIDSLTTIVSGEWYFIKDKVWDFCEYVMHGVETDTMHEMDKNFLNDKIKKLADTIGYDYNERYIQ